MIINSSLYDLITNEELKMPDASGNTPLILRATEISKLDKFSKEKETFEDEVCEIVTHFDNFNQTHFSELESYITVSNFFVPKILDRFSRYVKSVEESEDLFFKGCVVRFIQKYNKSAFQLDYIKNRFHILKKSDPWLYAELVSNINWNEGVFEISEILKINNNTSYLFPLITHWITEEDNENRLNYALEKWFEFLSEEDKEFLKIFCQQYGYNSQSIQKNLDKHSSKNKKGYLAALERFKNANTFLKFESITA